MRAADDDVVDKTSSSSSTGSAPTVVLAVFAMSASFDRASFHGINRGTMGPQDISGYDIRADGTKRARYGMHVFAQPRAR